MRKMRWTLFASLALLGGCQHQRAVVPASSPAAAVNPVLATRPANDPSLLTLDQVPPPVSLPQPAPTTRPAQASPEAIQLYARGWAARRSGDRANAVKYFQQALVLDPDSFDVNFALGITYLASPTESAQAMRYLTRAADLQPDDLEVQGLLARSLQAANDVTGAIQRLRMARLTPGYANRNENAALVDLFLARALRHKGYDMAALQVYQSLLERFSRRLNVRGSMELYFFLGRPENIDIEAGELYEKLGYFQEAAKAYQAALDRDSDNFGFQTHLISAWLELKNYDQARDLAVDLVSKHQANGESVDLLKEVYRRMGKADAVAGELRRLVAQRPTDRAFLFALTDVLGSTSGTAEAVAMLKDVLAKNPGDPAVVYRLFDLYWTSNDTTAAARLVIESLAQRPATLDDLDPLWMRVVSQSSNKRLQLPALQRLEVSPAASSAKLYWLARTAQIWSRSSVMRSSLEQAVAVNPPFAPAYRALLDMALRGNGQFSPAQRDALAKRLIAQARQQSRPALAEELNGLYQFSQKKFDQAAEAFSGAISAGERSPSVRYSLAMAELSRGRATDGEAALQKVVEQYPTFAPGQQTLYLMYEQRSPKQADRVLSNWLAADPFSINARLVQVRWLSLQGRGPEAQAALSRLFAEEPENPTILMQMRNYYLAGNHEQAYLAKLEEALAHHPENHLVAAELVNLHLSRKRTQEAVKVVDQLHAAVKGDADQLYFAAGLYQLVDRKQTTEQVLAEVLKIDPANPTACNDLGYTWAEEGRNMDQAESMIRTAVQAEPENAAFLDSLGWVLYKRGKFEEARQHLQNAVDHMDPPDATVLDHLGDALYRLSKGDQAIKQWQQALAQIDKTEQSRPDMAKLMQTLKQKIASQQAGQAVEVAPLAETRSQARQ